MVLVVGASGNCLGGVFVDSTVKVSLVGSVDGFYFDSSSESTKEDYVFSVFAAVEAEEAALSLVVELVELELAALEVKFVADVEFDDVDIEFALLSLLFVAAAT